MNSRTKAFGGDAVRRLASAQSELNLFVAVIVALLARSGMQSSAIAVKRILEEAGLPELRIWPDAHRLGGTPDELNADLKQVMAVVFVGGATATLGELVGMLTVVA